MALASGSPYYMAPASAKKMAADLATLPAWYADAGSDVWVSDARQVSWLREECRVPLAVEGVTKVPSRCNEVMPWGWNPSLLHRLESCFPSHVKMEDIRALSSRKTAI